MIEINGQRVEELLNKHKIVNTDVCDIAGKDTLRLFLGDKSIIYVSSVNIDKPSECIKFHLDCGMST